MVNRLLLTLTVGVLAAMLTAAGCGGSDEPESLTKAEYVKRANAICVKLNKDTSVKFDTFYREPGKPTTAQLKAMTKSVYLGNMQARLDQLRELPVPEGEEAKVDALLAAMQKGIDEAASQRAIAFQNTTLFFTRANKLAQELGPEYCYGV